MSETSPTLERELRRRPTTWEPWLVYADYLSARGDARGRLIGLEHQLASTKLAPELRSRLAAEIDELRETTQPTWMPSGVPEDFNLEWAHGFVVGVTIPFADDPLDVLPRLLADPQARLLSRLCLRPAAARTEIDDEDLDDEDLYGEGRSPEPVSDALVGKLLALELGSLSSLAIPYSPLGVAGIQRVASCDRLTELLELDLRYGWLDDPAIETLSTWPRLAALERLHLQRNRIGSAGAHALAGVSFSNLRMLDLRHNPLTAASAKALAASPGLARLEALYVTRRDIGRQGALALAQSPYLPFKLRRHMAAYASTSDNHASLD